MGAKYGWMIDKDRIVGGSEGEEGPRDIPNNLLAQLHAGKGTPFKMYDSDDELYYTGRIVGEYTGFEPLHDFGTPNAGATEIRYRQPDGTWKAL